MFFPDFNQNVLIYETRLNYRKNCLWGNLWCFYFCLAGKVTTTGMENKYRILALWKGGDRKLSCL